MGQVVWFSTLLILVFSCQGTAQQYFRPRRNLRTNTCSRDMGYDLTKRYSTLELMRDFTLNGNILCDTADYGGGWIVIQKRNRPSDVDFNRDWNAYKEGFGLPPGDFWLGNEALYRLTDQDEFELKIDFNNGNHSLYAWYSSFKVESEANNYTLRLGSHSGTLREESDMSGFSYSNGMQFSTYDRDNDLYGDNCALNYDAGWWYNNCCGFYPNSDLDINQQVWYTGDEWYFANAMQIKIRRI